MLQEVTKSPVVCIVEDDEGLRLGLESLLRSFGMQPAGHGSLEALLTDERRGHAVCLLLDHRLPGQSGLEFLIDTAESEFNTPTVLMTGLGDMALAVRAMKAGAVDVLSKPFSAPQLLAAINLGIEASERHRRRIDQAATLDRKFAMLTPREHEVLELVAAGLMNKQVAWRLGLSEVTVKIHRGNLMRKLQAKSLAELVRMVVARESRAAAEPRLRLA